jgi:hypothetical protein
MERMIMLLGNASALLGVLLCAGAGVSRLLGHYLTFDYATMTLFQIGAGLMVLGCLCKLEILLIRTR